MLEFFRLNLIAILIFVCILALVRVFGYLLIMILIQGNTIKYKIERKYDSLNNRTIFFISLLTLAPLICVLYVYVGRKDTSWPAINGALLSKKPYFVAVVTVPQIIHSNVPQQWHGIESLFILCFFFCWRIISPSEILETNSILIHEKYN